MEVNDGVTQPIEDSSIWLVFGVKKRESKDI